MKRVLFATLLLLVPSTTFACSPTGYTLIYVNGILTSQSDALHDLENLQGKLGDQFDGQSLIGYSGYNPVHLDGYGDELESVSQAFNAPISDYDLDTILDQLAPEVTTQKILLVGHSQGTFYTNEMYDYLVKNGVSPGSVAVYNLATPAGSVAGGGKYLTSSNDKVINYVRQTDAQWGAPQALPANIALPQEPGYASNQWAGHLPVVYFDGAPERIVADIQGELGKLSAAASTSSGCFAPPSPGLSYALQEAAFTVADPAVADIDYAADDARNTVVSVVNNANDIIHTAIGDALFSVIPRPTLQNAAGAFAVEKALYGSSMSVADYEALAQGQDIPEVESSAPQETQETNEPTDVQKTEVEAAVHSGVAEATSSQPSEPFMPSSTPPSLIPPASEPVFAGISISPGFGGGAAPQTQPQQVATGQTDAASSSNDIAQTDPASSTETVATTTAATSSAPIDSPGDEATSSAPEISAATTSLDTAPVTDSFDAGFSGWNNYALNRTWTTGSATNSAACYSGGCVFENGYDMQFENIKNGTPLDSGSFVIYFRNDEYYGGFGAGVCTDATSSQCQNPQSVGGADALLFVLGNEYHDDAWHYLYFAFRDGSAYKEYCGMVDDDDPADCSWQISLTPSGTIYSGVVFFTENGLDDDSSFYWDELGTVPYSQNGP